MVRKILPIKMQCQENIKSLQIVFTIDSEWISPRKQIVIIIIITIIIIIIIVIKANVKDSATFQELFQMVLAD